MNESNLPPYWQLPAVICLLGTLCVAALWHGRLGGPKSLPLPPQPRGSWILGNLSKVINASTESLQHLLMQDWSREHGEVFRVRLGPDIMDRSSAVSSERPRWIVSNELICNELNVLLLHASDPRWKHQRRVINSYLTSIPRADAGLPILHYETARFLHDITNEPEVGQDSGRILNLLARYTYSAFATQAFGMDIPRADDPVIDYIHETGLAQILGTIPGRHMVDIFAWMNYLPLWLKPWERDARKRFKRDLEWCMARLQRIKDPKFAGKFMADAFLPSVLRAPDRAGFTTQEEAAYLSLQLIIGAADTSQISTWSFLEAMLQYPDVQQKARSQIEAVVGDRLPEFADLERIPYIRCVMKEVWRWRPPVSLGHPHVSTKDITYNQQRIPKGARLHLNAWAISHDARRHEDPDRFWPERYANDHTTTMQSINSPDVTKRDHFAFGAGRRICPGYHVAERSLAIAIMRILWAFQIQWAPGTKLPVDPLTYMRRSEMPGNASSRLPVTLQVLSPEKAKIIHQTFAALQQERLPIASLS
ncbi:cytochrome P450 [Aspergillus pseudocaelatus]|uniref:Cytochrome P450 n=1 Tax=Aspergillus pseudocaelatus TaxID=1825620 RepID=A0ABQ6WB39_9EURO|nr:cytochrome P450 [Aspergillus pseudocaelatus]